MNLQGRNLETNMRGDDVALLQTELNRLRLSTQIVDVAGFFGSTTLLAVREFQQSAGLPVTGIVDPLTAERLNQEVDTVDIERFLVRGEVRRADGSVMAGVVIRVERRGLRRNETLGQATSDPAGAYSVEYTPRTRPISIVVHAIGAQGDILVSSPAICRARPVEVVNLSPDGAFRGPSEFELLQRQLAPILAAENIRVDALEPADLEWLGCAHGLNPEHVALLALATRMVREAGQSALSAEVFYGLVRQGLPTVLIALLAQPRAALERALESSVEENIVSARLRPRIATILGLLQQQVIEHALREPAPDRQTFRALLDIARAPLDLQRSLLSDYLERTDSVADFWARQRARPGANDDVIDAIQYTVSTAAIALNHTPMVRELMRMRAQNELGSDLRALARFRREDWQSIIRRTVAGARVGAPTVLGENAAEREERYAIFLERLVETLFPTPTLMHRLQERDSVRFAPTLTFLQRHPEFEFRTQRVAEFLRTHPDALTGIADAGAARAQLHAVERMMNIAPQFAKVATVGLIATGVESAFGIRRMGPTQFIRTHAQALGGASQAQLVYTNAARQSDTALMLLSQSTLFNPTPLIHLVAQPFNPGVPELENLFGSLDLCQCDQCTSVYSPAAYLVDILHFLMNRPSTTANLSALDVLFQRRPDIGEIELTCQNTNTELPHVDLVNEVLEHAVAPQGVFPHQTEGDAETLAANPEHVNEAAYETLREAVYPWNLPFDLWAAESRSYLTELGIQRHTLMEHFRRPGLAPEPVDVAAEFLGLTPSERSIITGTAEQPTRVMWGMSTGEFNQLLQTRNAGVVLRRSGLSYEELVQLLEVPLVDPGRSMHIEFEGASCNVDTATITALSASALGRIHRFIRLQRKLGWPIPELGDTLASLGITSLNDAALLELAAVKRLRDSLRTPLETLLTWWSAQIETQAPEGRIPLYDRVFDEPTLNPATLDIFQLNNARSELANPALPLVEHVVPVSIALGTSADDLTLLLARLPTDRLNLANLTRLYKEVTLARALKLSIADHVALRSLGQPDPFDSVAATEQWLSRGRLIKQSGFGFETLNYLLRHRLDVPAALPDEEVGRLLGKLQGGLAEIAADTFAPDPDGTRVRLSSESLVIETLSGILNLDPAVSDRLARELVPAPGNTGTAILSVFLAPQFIAAANDPAAAPPAPETFPDQFRAFHRLAKIALVLGALDSASNLDSATVLLEQGAALGWLDLNALPLEPQDPAAEELERFARMVSLFRAASSLPDGIAALSGMFGDLSDPEITRDVFLDRLAERTGYSRADADFLTGSDGFDLQFPADFASGEFLVRLNECFKLLKPLGVAAQEAWQWAVPAPDAEIARAIKLAARAKADDRDQWLAMARPIRDELREQQRSALVGYLVHERGLENPNGLYEHFLIDVEMCPCMLTSRIVLATNAVQLFVQRCLLNLESAVVLSEQDASEWQWMSHYRYWEGNRKVFLYPENWIAPELRDDKTPFFVDLERGLLQDELNHATAEREYLKYLEQLDRVAQVEVIGLYRHWEPDRDILHVIGRTRNTPNLYFHRQWVDQRYWTPWRRVEADIEGSHVVPIVWNRRLYVFWPMFVERAIEEVVSEETSDHPPKRFYEMRLAWSEYRDGKWTPKRVSADCVATSTAGHSSLDRFSFWAYIKDGDLFVGFASIDDASGFNAESKADAILGDVTLPHFRISGASGRVSPDLGFRMVFCDAPPKTVLDFNALASRNANSLEVITAGVGYAVLDGRWVVLDQGTKKTAEVLGHVPSPYRLMTPHADRPFICRTPFFYQDRKRTFFILPSGRYTGGVTGSIDDLTIDIDAAPLELGDVLTAQTAFLLNPVGQPSTRPLLAAPTTGTPAAGTPATRLIGAVLQPPTPVVQSTLSMAWEARLFRFDNFYHPYAPVLIEQLNRHGIDGILRPDPEREPAERKELARQLRRQQLTRVFFNSEYEPNHGNVLNVVDLSAAERAQAGPLEEFDFSVGGAYSIYNWELFFHAPFMLAKQLSGNQRFAEAQRWFHYIFDPTQPSDPDAPWPICVWQIKPFLEHGVGESIQQMMLLLKSSGLTSAEIAQRQSLRDQIEAWRKNPFNPHLIARMRPDAYMKAVVMAYLDNLIAWGDHLFRQDTRESINEATQLYILAQEILGDRPREIAAHEDTRRVIDGEEVLTFNQLSDHLDAFSNALIELETILHPMDSPGGGGGGGLVAVTNSLSANVGGGGGGVPQSFAAPDVEPPDSGGVVLDLPLATPIPAILGPTLFFCIPKNDQLLRYWDTVADRLFKIRNCMNIEGITRQLSLFAPPIDPGLLVKAAAAGVDLGSVLSDLNAPLPHYRFQLLAARANELINDVKNLGGTLLSVLEKSDAEELALLRSTHETGLLEAMRQVKQSTVEEARQGKLALDESRKLVVARQEFYGSREKTNAKEDLHIKKLDDAQVAELASQGLELVRAVLAAVPNFDIGISGFCGTPKVTASWGGENLASVLEAGSRAATIAATVYNHEAVKASLEGGYDRRMDDWLHQLDLAEKELVLIDKQIAGADIRIDIAQQDLANHELQVENSKAVDAYLRSKYTNQELYAWMLSQISAVYFQSYQLAFDMAKRAERAFRHELQIPDTSFIQFGYWDSLKKGLLSAERLQIDLRRMESAYLDANRREREITQHFSLAMLDPAALLRLRETGTCEFAIPELAFDLAYSGQFMRRIKTVSLTIPCVAGPYSNVSANLSLLQNRVRVNGESQQGYAYTGLDDPNFRHDLIGIEAISTSSAQNDSGLFQLNFQDERYLPFEGAGAISRFRVSLPTAFRAFDYDTITDVVLHMSYTARDGGDALRQTVDQHVTDTINHWLDELAAEGTGLQQLWSLKREFPNELHRFFSPAQGQPPTADLRIGKQHFPHFLRNRDLTITSVMVLLKPGEDTTLAAGGLTVTLNDVPGTAFSALPDFADLQASVVDFSQAVETTESTWRLQTAGGALDAQVLADIYLLVTYRV